MPTVCRSCSRGRADRLSALRRFFFPAGLARFAATHPADRPFFLQHGVVRGASTPKFSFFQKQQTDAEKGESDDDQCDRDDENRQHNIRRFRTKISLIWRCKISAHYSIKNFGVRQFSHTLAIKKLFPQNDHCSFVCFTKIHHVYDFSTKTARRKTFEQDFHRDA